MLAGSVPAMARVVSTGGVRAARAAQAASHSPRPGISARGGELIDLSSGGRMWSTGRTVPRPMGSITKVMTALIVLQDGDLSRKVTVTRAVIRYVHRDGASSAGLVRGDVLTARELLAAMLIPSGCDAAYLLATAYGPGRTAFIAEMNAKAASMGLTGTHFTSFDGMPYPTEHSTYSTPADLIRLGAAAMKYKLFREIVARRYYKLRASASHHRYRWVQTNKLMFGYRGALGIKTGDTTAAGNCLLFEARRHGVRLIGVVLHAAPGSDPASAIAAARKLLNWGFSRA
jgi:serine-type D-Ala-D-Ala carboxypeptidase (penicillin-binding protein 5/6)